MVYMIIGFMLFRDARHGESAARIWNINRLAILHFRPAWPRRDISPAGRTGFAG